MVIQVRQQVPILSRLFSFQAYLSISHCFAYPLAHSTAHFWSSSAAFYFGGALYYNAATNKLEYNAGRDNNDDERRDPCIYDPLKEECIPKSNLITNSKVFLVGNVGIGEFL